MQCLTWKKKRKTPDKFMLSFLITWLYGRPLSVIRTTLLKKANIRDKANHFFKFY